jgi:chromosome partitioning protein
MEGCRVIAVCNQKGGVGKSTTALNLSAALAAHGHKVLAADMDSQADLTASCGFDADSLKVTIATVMERSMKDELDGLTEGILHHEEGFDLMPSSIELAGTELALVNAMSREHTLKNWLDLVKDGYDYVIIDCMPSLGMMTVNALTAADEVIIPVQSHYLPAKGMVQLIKTVDRVRRNVNPSLRIAGILVTLVDSRTNIARDTIRAIRQGYTGRIPIFKAEIPLAVSAAESPTQAMSLFAYDPKGKAAAAYAELAREVIDDGKAHTKGHHPLIR